MSIQSPAKIEIEPEDGVVDSAPPALVDETDTDVEPVKKPKMPKKPKK